MAHIEVVSPKEIEQRSFAIITQELEEKKIVLKEENAPLVKRVIHTSADFSYAENLVITPDAVQKAKEAIRQGASIVTDTNMAKAGIHQKTLEAFGGKVYCYMAEEDVAKEAAERQITRAAVCMERGASLKGPVIFAIGNAPTALLRLCELMEEGKLSPALLIGVPVGFVNVVESKERVLEYAEKVPMIVARGRKGGSNVAAAICNALLYMCREEQEKEKEKAD